MFRMQASAAGDGTLARRRPPLVSTLRHQKRIMNYLAVPSISVSIEFDQPLVADPEVMCDLVEHDVPDLAA